MEGIMDKKTENEDNFKKYQERFARIQQENLMPSLELPIDQLIMLLCAEGAKLLAAEEKLVKPKLKPETKKDDSKKLATTLAKTSTNPYVRARALVLEKMLPAKRKEIEEMERVGNTTNKTYIAFLTELIKMGDTLSNQN